MHIISEEAKSEQQSGFSDFGTDKFSDSDSIEDFEY